MENELDWELVEKIYNTLNQGTEICPFTNTKGFQINVFDYTWVCIGENQLLVLCDQDGNIYTIDNGDMENSDLEDIIERIAWRKELIKIKYLRLLYSSVFLPTDHTRLSRKQKKEKWQNRLSDQRWVNYILTKYLHSPIGDNSLKGNALYKEQEKRAKEVAEIKRILFC